MLELVIAALIGLGWIGLSYAVEQFFPIGDFRWLVFAIICFVGAGIALHLRQKTATGGQEKTPAGVVGKTERPAKQWEWQREADHHLSQFVPPGIMALFVLFMVGIVVAIRWLLVHWP